jgi:hypothetical protein
MSLIEELLKLERFEDVVVSLKERGTSLGSSEIAKCLRTGKPEIIYLALAKLVEKGARQEIADACGLSPGNILAGNAKKFLFPVVNEEGKAKILEGIVIPLNVKKASCFGSNKDLNHLLPYTGRKGFIVAFSGEFSGSSFEAPLVYTLLYGEIPDPFLLTGKIEKAGFQASYIEEKKRIAKKEGKFLIYRSNSLQDLKKLIEKEKVEIPFLVLRAGKNVGYFLKKISEVANVKLDALLETFDLEREDLYLLLPEVLPPGNWKGHVHSFNEKIKKLKRIFSSCGKTPILHVGLDCPSSLAIGLGAVIGESPLVVYHYIRGRESYIPVVNLYENSRKIKERKQEFKLISHTAKLAQQNDYSDVFIAVQLASHEIRGKAENRANSTGSAFYYIESKQKGNIDLQKTANELVSEIYSCINQIYENYHSAQFHLIMSVPVVIAFSLGIAVGTYWNINVYNYFANKGDYSKILSLKDLKYI